MTLPYLCKVLLWSVLFTSSFCIPDCVAGNITITCRDYLNGIVSLTGYYEPHPKLYDQLGTYAYLCSKEKVNCSQILSKSSLTRLKWSPASYSENKLKFECPGTEKFIKVTRIKMDQNEWDQLISVYGGFSKIGNQKSDPQNKDQISINCHSFSDGTISLSGFFDQVGAITYACKKSRDSCKEFASRSFTLTQLGSHADWEKAKFSAAGNRFICEGKPKANPAGAIKGIKVNQAKWDQLILNLYKRSSQTNSH